LRDGREASACAAAAYVAIPYPLSEGLAMALDDEAAPPLQRTQVHNASATALALLAVTVVSTYEPVDTVSRSITFQSACLHGMPLHVLGVGAGTPFPPGLKIAQFIAFLERIPVRERDRTVVLFVDGFDVLFQAGPAVILERFLRTNKRLLFGGDHSCFPFKYWPDNAGGVGEWMGPCTGACSNSRYVCDTLFPRPPGAGINDPTNRWLNSGGIVGYASAFLEVLHALRGLPPGFVTAFPGADQAVYAALYLSRAFAGTVAVDHGSEVFLSFGLSRDPAEAPVTRVKDPQNLLVRLPPEPPGDRREQHGRQSNLLGDVRWANTYYYRPTPQHAKATSSSSSSSSSGGGGVEAAQKVPAVVHFNGEDGKHALRRLQQLMLPHIMRHSKRHVMYWVAWVAGWGRGNADSRAKDRRCAATVTPHPVVPG